jgi:peptidoglycan-associated lipoprotein
MQKKLCVLLVVLFVVPGLLFTACCAKKAVKSEASLTADDEASRQREAEAARQRAMEEERLNAEKMARNMFVNEDVYFEFDRYNLLPAAQAVLKKKAAWLRNNPDVSVSIEGHCDERGTNEYNIALGDRRAESAKAFLIDLGISGSRLQTVSYGEERPLDPGHNEEAWVKNRRAHFVI